MENNRPPIDLDIALSNLELRCLQLENEADDLRSEVAQALNQHSAAMAQARDETKAETSDAKGLSEELIRQSHEAMDALGALEAAILSRLPYRYDDGRGDDATPGDCLVYAERELFTIRREYAAARADIAELKDVLRWYFARGATRPGDPWEDYTSTDDSLKYRRRAMRLLGLLEAT